MIVVAGDMVIRYAQDGDPGYGNAVRAFEIDELTTTRFRQHEITRDPILSATGQGWNSRGMHHIDPHRLSDGNWIACVDGYRAADFEFSLGARRLYQKLKSLYLSGRF
jgi:hypothetical protein